MKTGHCIFCKDGFTMFERRYDSKDGSICSKCFEKRKFSPALFYNIPIDNLTVDSLCSLRNSRQQELSKLDEFKPNLEVRVSKKTYAAFDDELKIMTARNSTYGSDDYRQNTIISYDKIRQVELIKDNTIVTSKDGSGKAIAGSLLFGTAGAIIGSSMTSATSKTACKDLHIKITVSDYPTPCVIIPILDKEVGQLSFKSLCEAADQIVSKCALIMEENNKAEIQNSEKEDMGKIIEDLRALKTLVDEGILTEEEFTAKKKKVLGI